MNHKIVAIVLTLILSAMANVGQAQSKGREDRRQNKQSRQIHRGIKKGTISPDEAKTLKADQKKIQRMERRAERNGEITAHEGRKMERKQDKAAKKIRQARRK
jgi:hypothetical protein